MSQIILKQIQNRGAFGVKVRPQISRKTNRIVFEEESRDFGITLETGQLIMPNAIINTDDAWENYWLKIAKSQGIVVDSEVEGHSSPKAFFYIYNAEKAAETTVQNVYDKLDAQILIKELSETGRAELAKLLGFSPAMLTPTRITEELFKIAQVNPSQDTARNYQTILSLLKGDKEEYKYKLMFADLKFGNFIAMKNGAYYYGESFLGINEAEVIAWLKDTVNRDIVDMWKIQIYKIAEPVIMGDGTTKRNITVNNKK